MIYAIGGKTPRLPKLGWVAPDATVIGDVVLEEDVSVWWGAVLRGDNDTIRVGAGSNIQDNAVLHVDPGFPLTLGAGVTVGHLAMLHGCTIGEGTLIGIAATVLNGARIGRQCLIGAKALIAENKEIPDNSVVFGAPGKVVRQITPEELERMRRSAEGYRARWRLYVERLTPVGR